MSYESQRGVFLRPTYAVSASREPLGVLDAWMWAKQSRASDGSHHGVSESLCWIEGCERLPGMASQLPDVCARDLGEPVNWLLRSKHDRTLQAGQSHLNSIPKK